MQKTIEISPLTSVSAFESFFKSNYDTFCRFAFTLTQSKEEAEELVQASFVKIWEKKDELENASGIKTYLYNSIKNSFLNQQRHMGVRHNFANNQTTEDHVNQSDFDLNDQINIALDTLPEKCRLIFEKSKFEGMKYKEIADELGISVKTVENQMGKALKLMRAYLKDYLPIIIFLWIVNRGI